MLDTEARVCMQWRRANLALRELRSARGRLIVAVGGLLLIADCCLHAVAAAALSDNYTFAYASAAPHVSYTITTLTPLNTAWVVHEEEEHAVGGPITTCPVHSSRDPLDRLSPSSSLEIVLFGLRRISEAL